MTAAVFDATAIAARRRQLFGGGPEGDRVWGDRERFGAPHAHCGICPKPEAEYCSLSCSATRDALNDGVSVT